MAVNRLFPSLGCIFCFGLALPLSSAGNPQASPIRNVPKPNDAVAAFRARAQPSVPDRYTELPFIETAPEPKLTPGERERGFMLFHRPITEPVYPNTHPLAGERLEGLSAFAARGEFEPVTFSLYPVRRLENLKVRCSALENGGAKISGADIVVRLATYWNIGYPTYTSRDTYRRMPELLEQVTVHTSPAGECQRYWITVHVPKEAKPGTYTGAVTLWDDGFSQAVEIPLRIQVLDFELLKDPAKHSSVYYLIGDHAEFAEKTEADIRESMDNDYRAMVDHGLDIFPTIYLDYREGKLLLGGYPEEIEHMQAAGLNGPIPLVGDWAIKKIYEELVPGGVAKQHWIVNKMPDDSFYEKLAELFRTFREECEAKGLPELICAPIDEVAASYKEFGTRVYAAVKAAGFRTYATKDPTAGDAGAYAPYLDIWCSQPFSTPYEKIVGQDRYEYWCYPNHNACEIRDPPTMCKGGRMTYGFGFWRSGFTTLIPWRWSEGRDYLRDYCCGCGNRIDDQNRFVPAVYWECFREGWDDGRYIYTLQQAVFEREGCRDADCARAVSDAKRLLQKMWDDIHVQQKYLSSGMWPSEEFNARRRLLSRAIERLLAYPPLRGGHAPSVLVDRTDPTPQIGDESSAILEKALGEGKVERKDIGDFPGWRKGREGGDWPVGCPLTAKAFAPGELDMGAYDYLSLMIRVDSNRDEVAAGCVPLELKIGAHGCGDLYQTVLDFGDRQREWIPVRLSIKQMIQAANRGSDPWKNISRICLTLPEKPHADDGTDIPPDIGDVSLLRFKKPLISKMEFPGYVSIRWNRLPVSFEAMGIDPRGEEHYTVSASIVDKRRHRIVSLGKQALADRGKIVLDMSGVKPGEYEVGLKITDGAGTLCSEKNRPLFVVDYEGGR